MKFLLYRLSPRTQRFALSMILCLLGFIAVPFAHALTVPPPTGITTIPSPPIQSAADVQGFFCGLIVWVFWGLIILSIAMFLVGGYRYATAQGEPERVHNANKTLLYATVAVVVALVAAGIPLIIYNFLNSGSALGNACSTFG